MTALSSLLSLAAAVLFILSLRGLSHPTSAQAGLRQGMAGMALAVLSVFLSHSLSFLPILLAIGIGGAIGTVIAKRIEMTALPQLVAGFHALVGLAAVCVAFAAFLRPDSFGILSSNGIYTASLFEMSLGAAIGAITFTGSIIACLKLHGIIGGAPILLPTRHMINMGIAIAIVLLILLFSVTESGFLLSLIILLAFALGVLLIIPIGGADMPVIVSMLNSYSGWAAAGIGFTLHQPLLIIVGALVGASGAILSYIMCKAMNRSFLSVIAGGFGAADPSGNITEKGAASQNNTPVRQGSADDAAFIMANAQDVIIIPGYGMAVSQAQHAVRELADILKTKGVRVRYAIHPVAGRMPGHMNVLLAEANVPYDDVFELEDINRDFAQADVAYVIGANDITNPAARTDPNSPIYGMPVLDAGAAKTVLFVKRSMASGYAGVENQLFYQNNTMMLFGDAKKMTEDLIKAFEHT